MGNVENERVRRRDTWHQEASGTGLFSALGTPEDMTPDRTRGLARPLALIRGSVFWYTAVTVFTTQ
jgi:hypothetical protein